MTKQNFVTNCYHISSQTIELLGHDECDSIKNVTRYLTGHIWKKTLITGHIWSHTLQQKGVLNPTRLIIKVSAHDWVPNKEEQDLQC